MKLQKKTALTLLFALLLAVLPYKLHGQKSENIKDLFLEGDGYFVAEDYPEALYYFKELYSRGVTNANIRFKIGSCYLNIPFDEYKAIPFLESAVDSIGLDYKSKLFEETRAPLYALFYLGNAYRINNEIDKALATYDKFMAHPGFEGNYNLSVVQEEIKACQRAKTIMDKPVNVVFRNLGDSINNLYNNFNPVLTADGGTIFYMTEMKFFNAIMQGTSVNGRWGSPEVLNAGIMSDGDLFVTDISDDGNFMLLVKKRITNYGDLVNADIYMSFLKDGAWQKAEPLGKPINSPKNEISASFSSDGKTIYFSSNRSGGNGGYDLYKSQRESNGSWGKPQNLGNVVNTKKDEDAPFVTADGRTLFFCSNGLYTMGGFDIFKAVAATDTEWNQPQNLGYPVNTTGDNMFFYPSPNGTSGYISRPDEVGWGKMDILHVEFK